MSTIQAEIEARLADVEPEVEVLLAEVVGGDLVRLFIDHPDGVTLELCERVTHAPARAARALRARGLLARARERPLTKPDHFRRFVGRRARVRTRDAARRPHDRFTGELVGATDDEVTVAADDGVVVDPVRRHPSLATCVEE